MVWIKCMGCGCETEHKILAIGGGDLRNYACRNCGAVGKAKKFLPCKCKT